MVHMVANVRMVTRELIVKHVEKKKEILLFTRYKMRIMMI